MLRLNTLVVDGGHFFPGFLAQFLEGQGHCVFHAESPAEAIAKTRRLQPDLILLDAELMGVSGLDLMPELLMERPQALVIILAIHPEVAQAVEAIKLGAFDYLGRPIDFEKLGVAISLHRRWFEKNGEN